ncbi:glycosyltransferase family 9 protein [Geodermatophilus sabuli]|uniref:Glycosyltransferase family 9 protein n=1 Tax=Geodermatophilus sabuli TaxID=1564158 RepID=A0A7K3W473_9ACTN|nr:glycosyltransferase family 9 protein [Geodermatophilus sabuli]NEK59448.1 glycosyltransferase family 9 protein [Geodermatophilus sabuli]
MDRERMLVNLFYAQPVGHAIEALHYCTGHAAAVPGREVSVALNAATAVELAAFCPAVTAVHPVDHPFLEPCEDSADRLRELPRDWDWVVDDTRRHQPFQYELFPGMRDYYAASDAHLRTPGGRRSVVGAERAGYRPHQRLRLDLPLAVREQAARRLAPGRPPAGRIAFMPAGSSDASLYPSPDSWLLVLDALTEAFPGLEIVLVGRTARDRRTSTALTAEGLRALRGHRSSPVDCFDVPLAEQLAVVEACDVFLAPHTGFGLAALAVGTPWLALSGGRWFEYWFNHVPFRSVLPDTGRHPSFSQFDPAVVVLDGDDGPRTPSMTRARVVEDLERIVGAAGELLAGTLGYERAVREYVTALVAAHGGDSSAIWSIDSVHLQYL